MSSRPAYDNDEEAIEDLLRRLEADKPTHSAPVHTNTGMKHIILPAAIGMLAGTIITWATLHPSRYVIIASAPQVIKLDRWTGKTSTLPPYSTQWQEIRDK